LTAPYFPGARGSGSGARGLVIWGNGPYTAGDARILSHCALFSTPWRDKWAGRFYSDGFYFRVSAMKSYFIIIMSYCDWADHGTDSLAQLRDFLLAHGWTWSPLSS
jgi:hypothetical protein